MTTPPINQEPCKCGCVEAAEKIFKVLEHDTFLLPTDKDIMQEQIHTSVCLQAHKRQEEAEGLLKSLKLKLRDAQMFIESYHIDWDLVSPGSPDYDPKYKPQFPAIVSEIGETITALETFLKK